MVYRLLGQALSLLPELELEMLAGTQQEIRLAVLMPAELSPFLSQAT
jgi:hypothetical protein